MPQKGTNELAVEHRALKVRNKRDINEIISFVIHILRSHKQKRNWMNLQYAIHLKKQIRKCFETHIIVMHK